MKNMKYLLTAGLIAVLLTLLVTGSCHVINKIDARVAASIKQDEIAQKEASIQLVERVHINHTGWYSIVRDTVTGEQYICTDRGITLLTGRNSIAK